MSLQNLMLKAERIIIKKINKFTTLGTLAKIKAKCNDDALQLHSLHHKMYNTIKQLRPAMPLVQEKYPYLLPLINELVSFFEMFNSNLKLNRVENESIMHMKINTHNKRYLK